MRYLKSYIPFFISLLFFGFGASLKAQVVFTKGAPPSFDQKRMKAVPVEVMPLLDYQKIVEEDIKEQSENKPYRFGMLHKVNFTLENAGVWTNLPNGDRIWRLQINAPDAQTINLNYKKFDLPKGGRLFIYSESRKEVIGPFTDLNEKSNGEFATGFIKGESCLIEYFEPADEIGEGVVEVGGVVHGYRSIRNEVNEMFKAFQSSGQCNYDVDCSIGNSWGDQIKSVGLIMTSNNSRFCTGALINNTGDDCHSYFLSANHCFANDAVGDVLNDIFLFNYDSSSPACPGIPTTDGPTNETVQGATVIAKAVDSDFCLLELTINPLDTYDVYYSGWDRTDVAAVGAGGIHHPSGDVKKISLENATLVSGSFNASTTNTHWEVPDWDNGTTEPGSSGSPLFDMANKRIIGQLHGGGAACSGTSNNGQPDQYGKVFHSWDQNGTANSEQLAPWLDPSSTGAMTMDGNDCSTPIVPTALFDPADGDTFIFCGADDIDLLDNSLGIPTSWSWTFSGAGVSPTSSTSQNPVVNVSTTGTLSATLTVTNSVGTDMITQTYPITINSCVTNTVCDSPAVAIPDDDTAGVSSTLTVPTTMNTTDVDIEIDISHTYVGDLIITIEHNGVSAVILDQPGAPASNFGCNQDDIDCVFDDEGAVPAEDECNTGTAISGNVIPFSTLTVFDGIDPSGVWTITVSDNEDQDTGTLNSWCVTTTTTTATSVPCYTNLTHANGLLQVETGISDYESSDLISTTLNTLIESTAKVDYDATDFVELNAPFEVEVGAEFEAFIDGCNNGAGGTNVVNKETTKEE